MFHISNPEGGWSARRGEGDEEELSPEEAWRQRLADEAPAAGDFGGGFGDTYDAGAGLGSMRESNIHFQPLDYTPMPATPVCSM